MEIKDRVIKLEKINWKLLMSIRNEDLKFHTKEQLNKLEESIEHNGFIEPFAVWEDKKTKELYTINGHTRKKRLLKLVEDGVNVPEKLSAYFIQCNSLNEAAAILPLFESKYGNINSQSTEEFFSVYEIKEIIGSTDMNLINNHEISSDEYDLIKNIQKNKMDIKKISFTLKYDQQKFDKLNAIFATINDTKENIIYNLLML